MSSEITTSSVHPQDMTQRQTASAASDAAASAAAFRAISRTPQPLAIDVSASSNLADSTQSAQWQAQPSPLPSAAAMLFQQQQQTAAAASAASASAFARPYAPASSATLQQQYQQRYLQYWLQHQQQQTAQQYYFQPIPSSPFPAAAGQPVLPHSPMAYAYQMQQPQPFSSAAITAAASVPTTPRSATNPFDFSSTSFFMNNGAGHSASSASQQQPTATTRAAQVDTFLIAQLVKIAQERTSHTSTSSIAIESMSPQDEAQLLVALSRDAECAVQFAFVLHELVQRSSLFSVVPTMGNSSLKYEAKLNLDALVMLVRLVLMIIRNLPDAAAAPTAAIDSTQQILDLVKQRYNISTINISKLRGMSEDEFFEKFVQHLETNLAFSVRSESQELACDIRYESNWNGFLAQQGFVLLQFEKSQDSQNETLVEAKICDDLLCLALSTASHDTDSSKFKFKNFDDESAASGVVGQQHRLLFEFSAEQQEIERQNRTPLLRPNRTGAELSFHAELENGMSASILSIRSSGVEVLLPPVQRACTVRVKLLFGAKNHLTVAQRSFSFTTPTATTAAASTTAAVPVTTQKAAFEAIFDPCHFTMLHFAAYYGFSSLCRLLLVKCHMKPDIADIFGYTPLCWAVSSSWHQQTVLTLLEFNASISARTQFNETVLDIAEREGHRLVLGNRQHLSDGGADFTKHKFLEQSSSVGFGGGDAAAMVAATVESAAELTSSADDNLPSRLLDLINSENWDALSKFLLRRPSDRQLNATDAELNTPLHLAVRKNQLSLCVRLVYYGAQVNVVNLRGETPLHLAISGVRSTSPQLVQALIEQGNANPHLRAHPYAKSAFECCTDASMRDLIIRLTVGGGAAVAPPVAAAVPLPQPLPQQPPPPPPTIGVQGSAAATAAPAAVEAPPQPQPQKGKKRLRQQQTMNLPPVVTNPALLSQNSNSSAAAVASAESPISPLGGNGSSAIADMDEAARAAEQQYPAKLFIKPSRRKDFIDFIPSELCSSPYKYDILIRYNSPPPQQQAPQVPLLPLDKHLKIRLLIEQQHNQKFEIVNGVQLVKLMKLEGGELEWRVVFTVNSFHYQRKPFKLQILWCDTQVNHTYLEGSSGVGSGNGVGTEASDSSPISPHKQAAFAQQQSADTLPSDQHVIYESRNFVIVARKKKESYFWQNASSSASASASTPQDKKKSTSTSVEAAEVQVQEAENGGDGESEAKIMRLSEEAGVER